MLIDTHCHINFSMFRDDVDEVIRRSLSENVWMVMVGSECKTSRRALDLANKYEKGLYAAVGLHPSNLIDKQWEEDGVSHSSQAENFNYEIYEKLGQLEKVVAIGEIGLDYYRLDKDADVGAIKKQQQDIFLQQFKLARSLDLPVIIHCRQAHDDMIKIISDFRKDNKHLFESKSPVGVMHCFSGDEDLAWKYFSLGFVISFAGLVTFSKQWDNLIRKMPNDRFVLETDSPYLTPEPHRGKRNEPIFIKFIAQRIAEIKNLSPERVAELSTENAKRLFKIG